MTQEHILSYARQMGQTFGLTQEKIEEIIENPELKECSNEDDINKFVLYHGGLAQEPTQETPAEGAPSAPSPTGKEDPFESIQETREEVSKEEFYSMVMDQKSRFEQLREEFQSLNARLQETASRYATQAKRMAFFQEAWDKAEFYKDHQYKGVREACADGFYTFLGKFDGRLLFLTRSVTLSHRREGVDISLNFGQFLVQVNDNNMNVTVVPYEGNLVFNDREFHPHISSDGNLCWGEAGTSYRDAVRNRDFGLLLGIIRGILFTYNEDSPYVRIDTFRDDAEEGSEVLDERFETQLRRARRAMEVYDVQL